MSSPVIAVSVRTTPLTCGSQASVTRAMRTASGRRPERERGPLGGAGLGLAAGDLLVPVEDLHPPVEVLDQRSAAFDPVAVVVIDDAFEIAHLGGVDVPADHP